MPPPLANPGTFSRRKIGGAMIHAMLRSVLRSPALASRKFCCRPTVEKGWHRKPLRMRATPRSQSQQAGFAAIAR